MLPAPPETEALDVPACPRGLLAKSRQVWEKFWQSELAEHVNRGSEMYRAERWIRQVDELERAWKAFRAKRFTTGSMHQLVLSPAWKQIESLEALVAKSEEQIGMTPLARARLGLTLGQAGNELADLERRMNEPDEPRRPQAIDGEWEPIT